MRLGRLAAVNGHALMWSMPYVWCSLCGARTEKRIGLLAKQCRRRPASQRYHMCRELLAQGRDPVHGALLPDAQPRRAMSEEWCWWVGGPVAWWPSAQRHTADHRARCPERRGAGGRLGGDPSRFRCSRHVDLSFAISFTRGEGNRVSNRTWFRMVWRGWPVMIAPRLRSGALRFPEDQEGTSEDE